MESGPHACCVPCGGGAFLCRGDSQPEVQEECVAATLLGDVATVADGSRQAPRESAEGGFARLCNVNCGEGCNETDAQIRAELLIATVESKIRHRRLSFLAQLRTASPMLRALMQEGACDSHGPRQLWRFGGSAGSGVEGGNDAAPSWRCRRVD